MSDEPTIIKWKVTLEYHSDVDGPHPASVVLSVSEDWVAFEGARPPDECVALSMGGIMTMLQKSGYVIRGSNSKEVSDAFSDAMGTLHE